jgi:hypothetical protein
MYINKRTNMETTSKILVKGTMIMSKIFGQKSKYGNNYIISDPNIAKDALKDAMKDLLLSNMPKLLQTAEEEINKRTAEIQESIIERFVLKMEDDFNLDKLADPNMQFILNEAQINYIRYPGKDKLNLLSEMIATKLTIKPDNIYDLFLDEAITVMSKLNIVEVNIITLLYTIENIVISLNEYPYNYFEDHFNVILEMMEVSNGNLKSIHRLVTLGCLEKGFATFKREESFIEMFSVLFSKIDKIELSPYSSDIIIENELIIDSYRITGPHDQAYIDLIKEKRFKRLDEVLSNIKLEYKEKYSKLFDTIKKTRGIRCNYISEIIAVAYLIEKYEYDLDINYLLSDD